MNEMSLAAVAPEPGHVEGPLRDRRDPAARTRAASMYAWAIRKERHGAPDEAMQIEVLPTWELDSHDVLVLVMAAGVNYNGVWASLGKPISTLDVHKNPYHIAGSDASGIVWAVGSKVKRWKVGDEVVIHCNQDDGDDEECNGGDPMFSPSQRIWGYETPDGSFAQFCPRAGPPAPGAAEASHLGRERLLHAGARHRLPHAVRPPPAHAEARATTCSCGAPRAASARWRCSSSPPPAPTPSASCPTTTSATSSCQLGAKGVINRKNFKCWGQLPKVGTPEYDAWLKEARKFGKAIWEITGKGVNVDFVFEHPGEATFPVSVLRGEARRHGRDLRRHHRLQPHHGRALCVDASEARAGLALRQPAAGEPGQQARGRAPHRSVHVGGVPLGADPQGAHAHVEERAPPGQHGGAGQRAVHRPCAPSRTCSKPASRCMAARASIPHELSCPGLFRASTSSCHCPA